MVQSGQKLPVFVIQIGQGLKPGRGVDSGPLGLEMFPQLVYFSLLRFPAFQLLLGCYCKSSFLDSLAKFSE